MEHAEKSKNRKQIELIVCPLCHGKGKLHTSFYGIGNCSMADVINDKFPTVCRVCNGKGTIEVNEFVGVK